MSGIWQHASKQRPCLVCGKEDWCTFGDKVMLCQRVESDRPAPKGGWYHHYENKSEWQNFTPPPAKAAPKSIDAARIHKELLSKTKPLQYDLLARSLGVSADSLVAIGAAWSSAFNAWAFPMRSGTVQVIGIRLRNSQGQKWAMTGSRQGIFMAENMEQCETVFLPEGPTDTAALHTLGLFAIGRPTCMSGNDQINEAIKHFKIRRAAIVADNDDMKQLGSREGRPGIEGALKLQKELRVPNCIWIPPTKDAREFLRKGGTREMIEADIKNKVWIKS